MVVSKPKRNLVEHIVVLGVIIIVALLIGANIYYQREGTKQKALSYQLQLIRSSVNLFKVVEKRNPNNLAELARAIYTFPGDAETRKFLTNVPFDKAGTLVDPFGNNYIYDPSNGWIRSGTPGYEMW